MDSVDNIFSVLALDVGDDFVSDNPCSEASSSLPSANNGKMRENAKSPLDDNEAEAPVKLCKMPLVWIDLEMTGLDVEVDRILEIACIVTDGQLKRIIEGPDLVISQSKECLEVMNEWCQIHHGASGLKNKVLHSKICEKEAEEKVLKFVKRYVGSCTPLLAGNSVYMDLLFLKKYMPQLASIFSHNLVDVSSVKALCVRWFPHEYRKAPPKSNKHRAIHDIRESILELKFYKQSIFKKG